MSDHSVRVSFDEKRIDAIFEELNRCHLPGAAAGIAVGGKPVYRKGFGLASMELPQVLSSKTRMRIASVTKHFTCLAYLLLCEDGKASVDDPIGRYLPEVHPVTQPITARQLMAHVSGGRDAHDICWHLSGMGQSVSSADLLALYQELDDVNAAPGTTWNYNNGGYLMLSVAIERIAGKPLEDVLREEIFEPVSMHDTLLRRFDTDFLRNSATLHMTDSLGRFGKSYLGTALAGEGGIVSTIDDMLRWLAHMDAPSVGSMATWQMMKTPHTLSNGMSTGYGLGLVMDRYRGVDRVSHDGAVMGGNSCMVKLPAAGLDVMVMANRQDVQSISIVNKILDACLLDLEPFKAIPSGSLASGTFRSRATGRVIQLYAKEGQQIASIDGLDLPVASDEDGALSPTGWAIKQKIIVLGNRAEPEGIYFDDFGNLDELAPVMPVSRINIAEIAGYYRSGTTGTQIRIVDSDDGPKLVAIGRFGSAAYVLERLGDRLWRARSTTGVWWQAAIVYFDREDGCLWSTYRNRAFRFIRFD